MTGPPGRTASRRHRLLKGLIGVLVSAVFVWLAFRGTDVKELATHVAASDSSYVLWAVVWMLGIFAYKAFRWQVQLSVAHAVSWRRSFAATVIGYAANNVLPFRGGDLLRANVVARAEGQGTAMFFSTVVVERILDVASLAIMTGLMLLVRSDPSRIAEFHGFAASAKGVRDGSGIT